MIRTLLRLCVTSSMLFAVMTNSRTACAQTSSLTLSSGTTSGGSITLSLSLTSPAGSEPSAIQWSLTYPAANITSITASVGSAAAAAGKTVLCSPVAGLYTCVVYGTNSDKIANGTVANVTVTMTAGAPATWIAVNSPVAASPTGTPLNITALG